MLLEAQLRGVPRAFRSTEKRKWLLLPRISIPYSDVPQNVFLGALSTAWDLICRSALCARKRELPSTARRINASETSIFLVAKKGVAFHNFLESTSE